MSFEAFDLTEAVQIVGAPLARAKNWVFRGSVLLTPSVRVSRKPGSPSLYSREDLYRLALANELFEAGITAGVIAGLLEEKRQGPLNNPTWPLWAVRVIGKEVHLREYTLPELNQRIKSGIMKGIRPESCVLLLVDIGGLVRRVDKSIVQFEKERKK